MAEHWYTKGGQSAHTQPTKSKTAKNPTRPTNIRDAKTFGLLPSVTSILKVISNDGIQRWKHRKIVEACFNRPPIGDESLEGYTDFILEKAFDEADDAAELGTKIHNCIESHLKLTEESFDQDIVNYAQGALGKVKELGIEVTQSEFITTNRHYGYAGTTDLAFRHGAITGILDFKSKRTTKDEPIIPSFGHATQIAAYYASVWKDVWQHTGFNEAVGYNVYISTTEPGRIDVVKYEAGELQKEWDMFQNVCAIWRYKNNYDPRG